MLFFFFCKARQVPRDAFAHNVVPLCLSTDYLPMNSRPNDGYFHPLLASLSSMDMSSEQLHWKHFFVGTEIATKHPTCKFKREESKDVKEITRF